MYENKDKQTNIYKVLVSWALFALGLLTVVYPRFTGHPLFPVKE